MIEFIKFEKSHLKNKKYNAVVKVDGKIKRIPFGSSSYEQFRDATGLNLYSHLDHNDPIRRKNYIARHSKIMKDGKPAINNKLSPAYYSLNFLW
jgi:hypothetical protein